MQLLLLGRKINSGSVFFPKYCTSYNLQLWLFSISMEILLVFTVSHFIIWNVLFRFRILLIYIRLIQSNYN